MSEETTSQSQNSPKILVAEDNDVVRKGLVSFLGKWGYIPVEAANGDDAFNIIEKDPSIRLAILDWNLPGLSGLQICQRIRTRSTVPYLYIIMFSSRKSNEEKVLALDGGADDYLVKPCKPSELRARIGVGRRIIDLALNQSPSFIQDQAENNSDTEPMTAEEDTVSTDPENNS